MNIIYSSGPTTVVGTAACYSLPVLNSCFFQEVVAIFNFEELWKSWTHGTVTFLSLKRDAALDNTGVLVRSLTQPAISAALVESYHALWKHPTLVPASWRLLTLHTSRAVWKCRTITIMSLGYNPQQQWTGIVVKALASEKNSEGPQHDWPQLLTVVVIHSSLTSLLPIECHFTQCTQSYSLSTLITSTIVVLQIPSVPRSPLLGDTRSWFKH